MKKFNKLEFFRSLVLVAMILTSLGSVSATAQSLCNSQGQSVFGRRVWIDRFETGSINNLSGNNNGYGNFTSQTLNAISGTSIPFTIVTDNNLFFSFFNARIWIDLNADNDFADAGELVYTGYGNGTLNGSYTIPLNTTQGSKTMRVIVQRFGQPAACGNYFLGETEDYTVSITEVCNPSAGTLTAASSTVCFNNGTALLEATTNGNANVPAGYQTIYVLTSGTGLVIEQVNGTPSFTVTTGGLYTIHTLVYNPATLDLSIVVPGQTTGFDVNGLLVQGGGAICASLDVAGAPITVDDPDAGTLLPKVPNNCSNGGPVSLEALPQGNINVPAGYQVIYVLTSGTGLVIEQVNGTPAFTVTAGGLYTIHTLVYNPATLDLSIVVPGQTTGFDVNGLLVQGGGSICASLDVAGAPFSINDPNAGTLTAASSTVCFNNGTALLEATANGNANVPTGYQTIYVLTSGTGLVIEQVNGTPSFTVTTGGLYTIHTVVYNPATLDLSIVVPGQTTGFDVNGLLVQGGGTICASLDVTGAPITVEAPNAGTLTAASSTVCFNNGTALLEATANGNANVPAGYQTIYVLTSGAGLVIEQVNATPSFSVTTGGLYTIHTLVYNPATLDLSIVVPGQTTGFDVNGLLVQGGGTICASLDVAGAPITVDAPSAGTLSANVSEACSFNISASPDGNINVPAGYQTIYVLTSGAGLVIEQVNTTPDFTVAANGLYTIHTLVYNPATLDLSLVVPGQTTGFDVNGLLVQGGGAICASLDVAGAAFNISTPSAGTITSNELSVCFSAGTATISGTPDGNTFVPAGYQVLYVLTSGTGLVIEQVSTSPSFTVAAQGSYTIHTLVYNPATLDLSIVVPGQTTGFDVNSLLVQGGGSICASLDVAGAAVVVGNPSAGTIQADDFISCISNGTAVISATPAGNSIVPPGFSTIYVLTRGFNLTIQQVSSTPSFNVSQIGFYRVHTLVYNPATLNLNIVVLGQTTGLDVNALLIQGGGTICASLDVQGAPVLVLGPIICDLFNLDVIASNDLDAQTVEELKAVAESGIDGQMLIAKIYPNPASTYADVEFVQTVSGKISLSIYNNIGQKVMDQNFDQEAGVATKRIDLSELVSGNYLIKIDNGISSVTRILVVQN